MNELQTYFPKQEQPPAPGSLFAGATYDPVFDAERLTGQLRRVYDLMSDGQRRTLREIADAVHGSEAGVSARLRDLRKPEHGEFDIQKERVGDPRSGLWVYWMARDV